MLFPDLPVGFFFVAGMALAQVNGDLERAASFGHDTTAAGSASQPSSMQPMVQIIQNEAVPYQQTIYDPQSRGNSVAPSPPIPASNQATIQGLQRALTSLESTRQALLGLANLSQQQTCPDACDPNKWKKCTCVSPATYDSEGRGNCNFGATKLDTKVWCYVDARAGDPRALCPDAVLSQTKQGAFWSRYACIT